MTYAGESASSGIMTFVEDGTPGVIEPGSPGQVLQIDSNGLFEFGSIPPPSGAILGPDSSTDNALTRWDGTDATTIQDSLIIVNDSGTIVLAGGQVVNGVITTSTSYNVQEVDWLVISTATASRTILLPPSPVTWQTHNIKDGLGNSKSENLTIDGNGNTIDGCVEIIINGQYSSFTVVYNGTEWNII